MLLFQFLKLQKFLLDSFNSSFFVFEPGFELTKHISQNSESILVYDTQFLQSMLLVRTKHLTLATHRNTTVLAKVVNLNIMLMANLFFYFVVYQSINYAQQLVNETITTCHH